MTTDIAIKSGDMGWCPQANGGKGAVVGPLVSHGNGRAFSHGLVFWPPDGSNLHNYFGPITAIAVPLPADAPVGSRWQCVRGRYCGHVFKFPFGGYLLNMVQPTDLFISLPDAAPKELAMAHYADITAIDCVLRQLSDDTYARLMVAWRNGGGIEYWSAFFGGWRSHIGPEWAPHIKYRLASPPAVPDFIPWVAVHEQFNWYARDADRSIALYESCPKPKDTLWRSMGQEFPANVIAGIIIGDKPWDQSLVCRPGWEGK